jgi:membrane protein YqaA with SNARE-associated domain
MATYSLKRIYDWMGEKVHSPHALSWLCALFFIESFCFPIPVDPFLILFCIHNHRKGFFYAGAATIASVLGGLAGYAVGALLWTSCGTFIVTHILSMQTFEKARLLYVQYNHWAVLIAAFTPIPYKAITISAGFCHLPLLPFLLCSFIGRGARFFLIALLIRLWGPQIRFFIDRYFNWLITLFVGLIMLGAWFLI